MDYFVIQMASFNGRHLAWFILTDAGPRTRKEIPILSGFLKPLTVQRRARRVHYRRALPLSSTASWGTLDGYLGPIPCAKHRN